MSTEPSGICYGGKFIMCNDNNAMYKVPMVYKQMGSDNE